MFSLFKQRRPSAKDASRRRSVSRRFQVEGLEGRALMTLTGLNFGATVASKPVVMNGEMFFVGNDAAHGYQLWESNGTAAGTVRLSSGNEVNGGIHPNSLTVVGNTLYFAANDHAHGGQLWRSNGTASGTTLVTSSNDGIPNFGIYPSQLTNVNGTLYFTGLDLYDGTQLFTSNGTAAGTAMVKDIVGPAQGSYPANLTAAGGLLFFSATDKTHGTQLWETNGTAIGDDDADRRQCRRGRHHPAVPGGHRRHRLLQRLRPDQRVPVLGQQRHRGRDQAADLRRRRIWAWPRRA